jgi:hypothetical protein
MTENLLIASMRRSGGTLVGRLFDGHPECSVIPFEHWHTRKKATFRQHHHLLFPYLSRERKLRVCGFYTSYERKLKLYHPDSDRNTYRNQLLEMASEIESVSEFYQRSSALYFRLFHSSALRPKLVNHCANLSLLSPWQVQRIFGDHRMLLSVRDPRAVFCSLERHKPGVFMERNIPEFCRGWRDSVERYYLGDPSAIAFRFEDLVADPEKVMRSVCSSLGIEFDELLLKPTHLGMAAAANTSFSRKAGVVDPSAIDSWRSHLGARAWRMIEHRVGPLMHRLGYA